jgi:pyridoxamine 5'-phosphate oxidase
MHNADVSLAPSPSAGFDQPLVLIANCHERIRRMVELLVRLLEHLEEFGADERAAICARSIGEYFEDTWRCHFEDEELDLFPRVRARLRDRHSASAQRIIHAIDALIAQHRSFLPLWKRIEPSLKDVQRRTSMHLNASAVHEFAAAYRTHLDLEEDILTPAYAHLLTAEDLRQIGSAMATRRGQCWPGPDPASGPPPAT